MNQNRRAFVLRSLKTLLAVAVVGAVVGKSNTAEARRRCRRCCR